MTYHSIFLIIDSDNPFKDNYDRCREVWRRYMNSRPDIKCLFIRSNPIQKEDIEMNEANNTLSFKRDESYIPGILDNTLDAFRYCFDNYKFKFITRTNLSSVWDFKRYIDFIHKINEVNFVCGVINRHDGIFISGAGFTLPFITIQKIIILQGTINRSIIDDVALGILFVANNIPMINGIRYNYTRKIPRHIIPRLITPHYHYRVLYDRGEQDKVVSNKIVDIIYYS
jgi:hypothetical protein